MLEHGQVVRASVRGKPMYHYGLIGIRPSGEVYVFHNPFCCGPKIDSLEDFLKTRKITKKFPVLTESTWPELLSRHRELNGRKWNLIFLNCEDYINHMIGRWKFASAKIYALACVAISVVIVFFIGKKIFGRGSK